MANKLYEETSIQAIANAIRSKNGTTNTYKLSDMASAILDITTQEESVPTYHYLEALRVVNLIEDFKNKHKNNFIFGTITDNHVYANNSTYETLSKASVLHGAFALETVGAMTSVDFVANLGDNCWENGSGTDNAYQGSLYTVNVTKPMHERLTSFSLVGNHDKNESSQTIYDLIGQYNDFDVKATTQIRCFGYKDFTDKKVRVIALNTCDYLNSNDGGFAFSYEQKDFLMRALDLSAKSDYASWGIILLSHFPIDWNGGNFNTYDDIQTIINAYENGTTASITVNSSYAFRETPSGYATYSSGKLVYNYSGKNSARIIANIHGHVHTDVYGKLANLKTVRMASPNTCFYLGKTESYPDYGDYSIDTAISRTANSVTDTCATFYCIDLDEEMIYSYSFGAGNYREVPYKSATFYKVVYNLTNVTSSDSTNMIEEGESFNISLNVNSGYELSNVAVSMGGRDITGTAYNSSNGTIMIEEVTGDIVISANATAPLWTYTVNDIAVAIRSVWQLTSGKPTLANSNTEASIGVTTVNAYPYTDRESKTVYLMPVDSRACDVTVTNTDSISCTYCYIGLKETNETFAQVFNTSKIDANTYTWDAGSINYILISMERKDGTSWSWGYDDTKVVVTFTNGGTEPSEPSEPSEPTPTYTNIIDTVGTVDNVRLRSGGATGDAAGFASNYFPVKAGDIIRVYFPNGNRASIPSNGVYCCLYSNTNGTLVAAYDGSTSSVVLKNVTDKGYEIYIPADVVCSYARVAGGPNGAYDGWIVTVNEEINQTH